MAGRMKQTDWEARNLFMAGRLRQGTMHCVGGRLLAPVGNSHKGSMESALTSREADVRLVELDEVEQSSDLTPPPFIA